MPNEKINNQSFVNTSSVIGARLVVVYFLHQSRNEWVNWNGDTHNVRRPIGTVTGSIDEAYKCAERSRAPGTVFGMQDSIGIELICTTGTLLLAEQFTDSPFDKWAAIYFGGNLGSLKKLLNRLPDRRFLSKTCFVGSERPVFQEFTATTQLFKRSALAGGRQNGLGWSAKSYQPKLNDAEKIVALINTSVSAATFDGEGAIGRAVSATQALSAGATPAAQLIANKTEATLADSQVKEQPRNVLMVDESQWGGSAVILVPEAPVPAPQTPALPPPSPLESTEREQLTSARIGQGLYRRRLEEIETCCRVTGLSELAHLRASHIKPWRACTDSEKLDGNNGLLLSPHIDHLFDQGYITFTDTGDFLVSKSLKPSVLVLWKLAEKANVGVFNPAQRWYLAYHRENIFRRE